MDLWNLDDPSEIVAIYALTFEGTGINSMVHVIVCMSPNKYDNQLSLVLEIDIKYNMTVNTKQKWKQTHIIWQWYDTRDISSNIVHFLYPNLSATLYVYLYISKLDK